MPPDLTRDGALASWNEHDFIHALRTGATPAGRILDPRYMPWTRYSAMTDRELSAIWSYLSALPGAGQTPAQTDLALLYTVGAGIAQ